MKSKAIIKMYLIPTLLQITVIAALVGILKFRGFELGYNSFLGILFISLAGISSALWGIVYQVKCHSKRPLERIFQNKAICKKLYISTDFSDIGVFFSNNQ